MAVNLRLFASSEMLSWVVCNSNVRAVKIFQRVSVSYVASYYPTLLAYLLMKTQVPMSDVRRSIVSVERVNGLAEVAS